MKEKAELKLYLNDTNNKLTQYSYDRIFHRSHRTGKTRKLSNTRLEEKFSKITYSFSV